ncbi:hypothetical protein E0J09_19260 [Rhizobium leguminosarum bv. viciae]|nr:hypothetical protein E0H41_21755 [Rhizobium leguminosarum bv. viciae]TCB24685.1 hypothetical protein E0J09_19260 [Rhizobium leguminosarum bv. viciae]
MTADGFWAGKTCDIKDPNQNINWVPPQGGEGPVYPTCDASGGFQQVTFCFLGSSINERYPTRADNRVDS